MVIWLIVILFVAWGLLSAVILVSVCMLSSRFNQEPGGLEERSVSHAFYQEECES